MCSTYIFKKVPGFKTLNGLGYLWFLHSCINITTTITTTKAYSIVKIRAG